jgi:uncharacterized protein YhdP
MERVKRRWWTTLVSVFAVLVIAAAALSGAFQFAVLALPSYRDDLSSWVTSTAGRPVQIGGINLVWRSFLPQIDLSDIKLYSVDGKEEVLSADRLSVGFGLLRLATGDLTPTSVELAGLSLEVRVDENGKVLIEGLDDAPAAEPVDYTPWIKQLTRFTRVRLKDCEIDLTAPTLPEEGVHVVLSSAQITKTASGADFEAELMPPAEYARLIEIDGEVTDPLDQPSQWNGDLSVAVRDLQPNPWLRGKLLPETQVLANKVTLQLAASLTQGRFSTIDAHLETGALIVKHKEQSTDASSLDVLVRANALPSGWQAQIAHVEVDDEDQLMATLNYVPTAQTDDYEVSVETDSLKLDRLTPWLAYWRDPSPLLAAVARASGEITALQLRATQHAQTLGYTVRANLKQLALAPTANDVGFSQLEGELSANEDGGHFDLAGGALTLVLPKAIKAPIPFEKLSGVASWQRAPDGWQIKLPGFAWKLASTQGEGSMNLLLPDARSHCTLQRQRCHRAQTVHADQLGSGSAQLAQSRHPQRTGIERRLEDQRAGGGLPVRSTQDGRVESRLRCCTHQPRVPAGVAAHRSDWRASQVRRQRLGSDREHRQPCWHPYRKRARCVQGLCASAA